MLHIQTSPCALNAAARRSKACMPCFCFAQKQWHTACFSFFPRINRRFLRGSPVLFAKRISQEVAGMQPLCFDACRSLSQKILLCNIFWEPCFCKANFARGRCAQPLKSFQRYSHLTYPPKNLLTYSPQRLGLSSHTYPAQPRTYSAKIPPKSKT